jgi:hypothetical protein
MICVQGEGTMNSSEWEQYTDELHALYRDRRVRRILVFSDGEGPDARQRKRLHNKGLYAHDDPVETAVITHSMVVRGIVTAISWFTDIRAFAPQEIDEAFRYLTIPTTEWEATRASVAKLRLQLSAAAPSFAAPDLTQTIGRLDDLLTDRLPKLRERIERARLKKA